MFCTRNFPIDSGWKKFSSTWQWERSKQTAFRGNK